jgi:AcrR family transcriptional regulator
MEKYSDKQVRIMQAAETLFAEQGFKGTSVRDIAETAGINLAMVSYYFGSKEKLFEAMFEYRSDVFKLHIESMIRNKQLSPMEKMENLIDQYIQKFTSQQCFHRVLVREQMVNNNEFITSQIQNLKKRNQLLIKKLVKEGQDKGVFRKDIDIPLMMITLVGTVSQLVTTQRFYKEMNGMKSLSEEAFQEQIRQKLSAHLKKIFKAILCDEK